MSFKLPFSKPFIIFIALIILAMVYTGVSRLMKAGVPEYKITCTKVVFDDASQAFIISLKNEGRKEITVTNVYIEREKAIVEVVTPKGAKLPLKIKPGDTVIIKAGFGGAQISPGTYKLKITTLPTASSIEVEATRPG